MTQHSPKYQLRAQDILRYLSPKRLEQKWRKKTRYDLKRQFFPDPVEYLDIHASIESVISRIRTSIKIGKFSIDQPRRFQVEKSLGLCRLMVQPSAEAALILQCLSDKLYSNIKRQSPSANAFFEPKDHSFKGIDEQEYGTFKSWKNFQDNILKFQIENKYIIVTDISNYYDFIDLNQLRNVITSFVKIQEPLFDFMLHIISSLVWRPDFMPPRQIGLPQIDLDAPRLLAHCYLFELDKFMEDRAQKNYAKFMDDIDAGVNTIGAAKKLLRDIDLVLQSRSLRLNGGKTRILTAKEAFFHFRVRDNNFLDRLEGTIAARRAAGISTSGIFQKASKLFVSLYRSQYFKIGNGEKVLKRAIGLYNKFEQRLPDFLFDHFIRLHPNLRDAALRNPSICGFRKSELTSIVDCANSGVVCDDYFPMTIARKLVEGRLIYDGSESTSIKSILKCFQTDDYCSVYALFWILSRFGTPKTIFLYLKKYQKIWSSDEQLSRLVAGLYPRMAEDKSLLPKFYVFISQRILPEAERVWNSIGI